jgi:hypothetical protein
VLDKDLLLKPRLEEEDYDISDVGTVRIRRLSWFECRELQKIAADDNRDNRDLYGRALALALVDPQLTEDEVGEWMCSATLGEIEDLARHIIRISGLFEGAQKSV